VYVRFPLLFQPRRGFRHRRWHLGEMYVKLDGGMVYLWRAVVQKGELLERDVVRRSNKVAAPGFMKRC